MCDHLQFASRKNVAVAVNIPMFVCVCVCARARERECVCLCVCVCVCTRQLMHAFARCCMQLTARVFGNCVKAIPYSVNGTPVIPIAIFPPVIILQSPIWLQRCVRTSLDIVSYCLDSHTFDVALTAHSYTDVYTTIVTCNAQHNSAWTTGTQHKNNGGRASSRSTRRLTEASDRWRRRRGEYCPVAACPIAEPMTLASHSYSLFASLLSAPLRHLDAGRATSMRQPMEDSCTPLKTLHRKFRALVPLSWPRRLFS